MIKKLFLSAAMATAFLSVANAQKIVFLDDDAEDDEVTETRSRTVDKPVTMSIGPKVGGNYTVADDPKGMDLGMGGSFGFSAGVAANLRFARPDGKPVGTERFGFQLEALYAQHNLTNDVEDIKISSFEIPILFQWYVIPTLAVEVGPTFTGAFSTSPKELKYNNTTYQTEEIKAKDVMLSFGVNYKHPQGFNASLRYNLGNSDMAGNFETSVSTVSLNFGWLFTVVK